MTTKVGCIRGTGLMDSMRSIVDAIEKGVEPRASGTIQHRSLETAIAMRESARRGSVPVRLPLEGPVADADASEVPLGQ